MALPQSSDLRFQVHAFRSGVLARHTESMWLPAQGACRASPQQSSDDLSGTVKNSFGQAGRNVRKSVDKMLHTGRFAPKGGKKKPQRGRKYPRAGALTKINLEAAVKSFPGKKLGMGSQGSTGVKPLTAPAVGTPGGGKKLGKGNLRVGPKVHAPKKPGTGNPGSGPKLLAPEKQPVKVPAPEKEVKVPASEKKTDVRATE
ncbi:unnamed protein product [Closterium sp. Naga37s-1]|nr:unnamed protein product [Closterium sp. Naga37s-1]